MKAYPHTDPHVKQFLQKFPRYAQQAKAINLPYWVLVKNSNPIGIVVIGREPTQLLASPGTPMAFVKLLDAKQSKENIDTFASKALELATQRDSEYALATFQFDEDTAISQFEKIDFKEFDDCYKMVCQLNKTFKPSNELQFRRIKRKEMRQFIKLAEKFLQGTPDVALTEALKHFPELSDEFLNSYYSMEKFHFATKNRQTVGVVSFVVSNGAISSIGVDPQQRGKGYGRQIMLFVLEQLKKSGCEQVYLRVHVENKTAVHLYESLGFAKAGRYKRLIWRKHESMNDKRKAEH